MKWFQHNPLPADHPLRKLDLEKYEREGVDLSLLLSNLKKTPTERAENNKAMILFVEAVRKNQKKIKYAHS